MTLTVRDYARSIVLGRSLDDKLRAPPAALDDDAVCEAEVHRAPSRDVSIALASGSDRLPKLSALTDRNARAAVLSRFAHHELCAVELFAWALLAFPSLPSPLRRGLVSTLAEEQVHCRLYLARLEAHGVAFGALPLSDYFWQHVDKLTSIEAFLCAMGLTLEQANLDFTLMYRDAFRAAGDDATADVIQRVHDDEIGHVKLATTWLKRLTNSDDVDAYNANAPFPFSLARAKGRRFDVAARKKAALSDEMIEAVRAAKPYAKSSAT